MDAWCSPFPFSWINMTAFIVVCHLSSNLFDYVRHSVVRWKKEFELPFKAMIINTGMESPLARVWDCLKIFSRGLALGPRAMTVRQYLKPWKRLVDRGTGVFPHIFCSFVLLACNTLSSPRINIIVHGRSEIPIRCPFRKSWLFFSLYDLLAMVLCHLYLTYDLPKCHSSWEP